MKSSLVKGALALATLSATTVAHAEYAADLRVQCSVFTENLVTHTNEFKEVEVVLKEVGSKEAGEGQLVAETQGITIRVSSPLTIVKPIMHLEVTTPTSQASMTRILTLEENVLMYRWIQSNIDLSVSCRGEMEMRQKF